MSFVKGYTIIVSLCKMLFVYIWWTTVVAFRKTLFVHDQRLQSPSTRRHIQLTTTVALHKTSLVHNWQLQSLVHNNCSRSLGSPVHQFQTWQFYFWIFEWNKFTHKYLLQEFFFLLILTFSSGEETSIGEDRRSERVIDPQGTFSTRSHRLFTSTDRSWTEAVRIARH